MSPKRALAWVGVWITTAIIFAFGVYYFQGTKSFVDFLTCYAIEWSLSLDNLFVFLMIFNSFGVGQHNQLRALEWGIMGAVVMRLGFILIGVALVDAFSPILYFFGALLLYSAFKMAFEKEGEKDIRQSRLIKFVRNKLPISKNFHGDRFFIKRNGKWFATPMILVLVAIESSDIMFAIDSIPAAFAITKQPMIIFFANMFAIMGLRSLYFLLVHADKLFNKLRYGVVIILAFVGVKIILMQLHIHINTYISLGVVLVCISGSILLSVLFRGKTEG